VGHSIKYSTADLDFYFLSVPFSGLELRSDDAFKPCHRGLDKGSTMIVTLLFSLFPTDLSHAGYPLITSFNMLLTSFAFLYLCIIMGWDNRFDGHALSHRLIRQKPVDMPSP
jgi:hypothetical protein